MHPSCCIWLVYLVSPNSHRTRNLQCPSQRCGCSACWQPPSLSWKSFCIANYLFLVCGKLGPGIGLHMLPSDDLVSNKMWTHVRQSLLEGGDAGLAMSRTETSIQTLFQSIRVCTYRDWGYFGLSSSAPNAALWIPTHCAFPVNFTIRGSANNAYCVAPRSLVWHRNTMQPHPASAAATASDGQNRIWCDLKENSRWRHPCDSGSQQQVDALLVLRDSRQIRSVSMTLAADQNPDLRGIWRIYLEASKKGPRLAMRVAWVDRGHCDWAVGRGMLPLAKNPSFAATYLVFRA